MQYDKRTFLPTPSTGGYQVSPPWQQPGHRAYNLPTAARQLMMTIPQVTSQMLPNAAKKL